MWDKESSISSVNGMDVGQDHTQVKKTLKDVRQMMNSPNVDVIEPEDFDEPQILVSFRPESRGSD